jgi:phosphoserine phosphatase RsbU/P
MLPHARSGVAAVLIAVGALLCAIQGHSQTFNLENDRVQMASLDGLWRFHTGDTPEWATTNLNDSQWALLRSDEDWAQQGYKDYSGFAWYRFRVLIPSRLDHVSLLIPPLATSYQVYVDGKLIGSFSQMPLHPVVRIPLQTEYQNPLVRMPMQAKYQLDMGKTSGPREATVALRVWHWNGWSRYIGGGPQNGGGLVGQSSLIDAQFQYMSDSRLLRTGVSYSIGVVSAISGTIALLLFLVRRKETEYLWFALSELSETTAYGLSIYVSVHAVPLFRRDSAQSLLYLIGELSFIFFLQTLLRGRRSVLFYLAIAAVCANPILYVALLLGLWPSVGSLNLTSPLLLLVIFIWSCDLLIRRAKAGLPDARLLLAPVVISYGLGFATVVIKGAFQLGWTKAYYRPFILFKYPFPFSANDLVEILFLIAMLAILTNRFMRSRREEQRLAGEFEAARTVQLLLVPPTALSTPGFAVESVYIPASEVGGDFFHLKPGDDGSLLIVVGDVSGKGLRAAMTVSTIVGALRNQTERQPAQVLAHLNGVLLGYVSGFVTCAAALVGADGAMTLANAGHLAPYCNGQELAIESGLPLGIIAEISWTQAEYQLSPGDRLTFVSDGVVEATNKKRKLFGFDRVLALSVQSASSIAEAAKQFGQEDDISVIAITRTGMLERATA